MLASYDRFDDTRYMINEVNDFMKNEEKKKTKFNSIAEIDEAIISKLN